MTKLRKDRKKEESSSTRGVSYFPGWETGTDVFSLDADPEKRTQKLLVEIQKRSLADQVLLLSWDRQEEGCQVLGISPEEEDPLVSPATRLQLMERVSEGKRTFFEKDFSEYPLLQEALQDSGIRTLFVSSLTIQPDLVDVLVIVNYSPTGEISRMMEFVSFASSVLAVSVQNVRLYAELKKKREELKAWVDHVEVRIEEGTKQLLEKEFQYYTLFEGANDGIIVHDASGKIREANRVACLLLGCEKKELLTLGWDQLVLSERLPGQRTFFKEVFKGEKVAPLETILRKKNGSTFHAELSSRKVRFRGENAIQSFVRDVSKRKVLEETLRESREKYRILVESSLVGVFIIQKGIIQFVNTLFEEMTGYTKTELFSRSYFDLIAPEDRSMVMSRETQREKGEDVPDRYEFRFLTKGGERRWAEARFRRVLLEGRSTVLVNVIDITQRKLLETQLLETRKMESIGTLAGGIAHDFNNLLGGILGYASLLLDDLPKDSPYYDDIHTIAETAKRGATLTNRLLAFARGGKYQITMIDMNRVVQDVVAILFQEVDRSVAIETALAEDVWPVKGDSKQVHQTILNIGLNARDAMPEGGRLMIETANVNLEESFARARLGVAPGAYVCVSISDTGVGMDEKVRTRIFEPFFTMKPMNKGKGLGLAVVYGVVKNHGGGVWVDSELGKGTTLSVFFPRFVEEQEEEGVAERKPAVDVPRSTQKGRRILLVDDEEVIRQVGRRMLEKGGFEVMLARNGAEAVEIYENNRDTVDLVVLDWIMPKMGGKQTYKRLREIDPRVRVVFTSGYSLQDQSNLLKTGRGDFVQKPFQTEVFIQTVRSSLERSDKKP